MNSLRWAMNPGQITSAGGGDVSVVATQLPEDDFRFVFTGYGSGGSGLLAYPSGSTAALSDHAVNSSSGNLGSCHFTQAIDLETSNGTEISGLNAEEQSDISLSLRYSQAQPTGYVYDVFTYVDVMFVLHENNVMELIQ